jgi:hypothetical protein
VFDRIEDNGVVFVDENGDEVIFTSEYPENPEFLKAQKAIEREL